MTLSLTKINNFPSFIAFFFIAKYANSNKISTRNLAPKIDNIADIKNKCSKTLNLILKHELSNIPPIDIFNEDEDTPATSIDVSLANSTRFNLDRYRSNSSISEYLQYILSYKVASSDRLILAPDMYSAASHKNSLRLLYSIVYGRDPIGLIRNPGEVNQYVDYNNPDYGRVDTYINYVRALSESKIFIKLCTSSETIDRINKFYDNFDSFAALTNSFDQKLSTVAPRSNTQLLYSLLKHPKGLSKASYSTAPLIKGRCVSNSFTISFCGKGLSKHIHVARHIIDIDGLYGDSENDIDAIKNSIKQILNGKVNDIEAMPTHGLRDASRSNNNVLFTNLTSYVNRNYVNTDTINTVILKSTKFEPVAFIVSTEEDTSSIFAECYLAIAVHFKNDSMTSQDNFSSTMSSLKEKILEVFSSEQL